MKKRNPPVFDHVQKKAGQEKLLTEPSRVLNNAKAFHIAAERLSEERVIYPNNQLQIPIVPLIVSLSFGLEMALKSILAHTVILPKTHELLPLFNKLPKQIQDEVASNLGTSLFEIRMKLSSANKAFSEWRYCYEYDSLNADLVFMKTFLITLISTSESLVSCGSFDVL